MVLPPARIARSYGCLLVPFSIGLLYWIVLLYSVVCSVSSIDKEGLGWIQGISSFLSVIVGLPVTLICLSTIERARNLTWLTYLAIFMGANAPSLLQGCTSVIVAFIPGAWETFSAHWLIANAVISLVIYTLIAVLFRAISLSFKKANRRQKF